MKARFLCTYYGIALIIITGGIYYYSNEATLNTLWDDGLCKESIEAHKHLGVELSLSSCYDAQHGVRYATILTIIGLDGLSTLLFIIGIDMNRQATKQIKESVSQ